MNQIHKKKFKQLIHAHLNHIPIETENKEKYDITNLTIKEISDSLDNLRIQPESEYYFNQKEFMKSHNLTQGSKVLFNHMWNVDKLIRNGITNLPLPPNYLLNRIGKIHNIFDWGIQVIFKYDSGKTIRWNFPYWALEPYKEEINDKDWFQELQKEIDEIKDKKAKEAEEAEEAEEVIKLDDSDKKNYVPFTIDDRKFLKGKWILYKHGFTNQEQQITHFINDGIMLGDSFCSFDYLLKNEFMKLNINDIITPVGKLKI